MTASDFSNEFDLLWDNINSAQARGLDDYEKSVFLTQAQEDIVKDYAKIYETSEKAREVLKKIVRDYVIAYDPLLVSDDVKIDDNSIFIAPPVDSWLIVMEQLITPTGKRIKIVPITHDEYQVRVKNPFRSPNESNGFWKIDVSDASASYLEIILDNVVGLDDTTQYKCRYIIKPDPIITADLTALGVTIEGDDAQATSILNSIVHREILERAVELATEAYKENRLQNKIMLNQRGA